MPQIFPRGMNTLGIASVFGIPLLLSLVVWAGTVYCRSSYGTGQGEVVDQAVPFSHQHHVGVLGIDCRYCHTSVEYSSYAGMPTTKICMNCHSQIWVGSQMLEPVRHSYATGQSLLWKRVNNLPGYVYFDHSIHIQKGVGCTTCHGRIDHMPLTFQEAPLTMQWCLDCHRQPEQFLRPSEEVFNVRWQAPPDQLQKGHVLAEQRALHDSHYLTSCSVCHR